MSWTKEKPIIEGWYWIWFGTPTDIPYCEYLSYFEPVKERGLTESDNHYREYIVDHPRETMYYGPIEPPEIPN